jgi:hypothetical protein
MPVEARRCTPYAAHRCSFTETFEHASAKSPECAAQAMLRVEGSKSRPDSNRHIAFSAVTRVRIPSGTPLNQRVTREPRTDQSKPPSGLIRSKALDPGHPAPSIAADAHSAWHHRSGLNHSPFAVGHPDWPQQLPVHHVDSRPFYDATGPTCRIWTRAASLSSGELTVFRYWI